MSLYAYTECNDKDGNVKSFSMIVADESGENRIRLNEIVPNIDGLIQCPGFNMPSDTIYNGAIYADEERVYGIRLLTYDQTDLLEEASDEEGEGEVVIEWDDLSKFKPVDIGSNKGTPILS